MLKHTRVFHTGSLSLTQEPARSATYEAIDIAKAAGAVISYDPNYRASLWSSREEAIRFMRSLIVTADIMKVSDEELPLLTGETDPEKAADLLLDQGVKIVAITLGSEGAYVRVGKEHALVPGFRAKAVDTTGAGDSFFGGFLYRFLSSGKTLKEVTISDAADYARLATRPPRSASSVAAEFPRCRSLRVFGTPKTVTNRLLTLSRLLAGFLFAFRSFFLTYYHSRSYVRERLPIRRSP
jgi:sugar/nucleoside kinase (ribokinase family)